MITAFAILPELLGWWVLGILGTLILLRGWDRVIGAGILIDILVFPIIVALKTVSLGLSILRPGLAILSYALTLILLLAALGSARKSVRARSVMRTGRWLISLAIVSSLFSALQILAPHATHVDGRVHLLAVVAIVVLGIASIAYAGAVFVLMRRLSLRAVPGLRVRTILG